jgi:hypothetical protein
MFWLWTCIRNEFPYSNIRLEHTATFRQARRQQNQIDIVWATAEWWNDPYHRLTYKIGRPRNLLSDTK